MKKKWAVYAIFTASKYIGEFDGDTKDDALEEAEDSGDCYVTLCHQCSHQIDLGDAYEFQAEEIKSVEEPK